VCNQQSGTQVIREISPGNCPYPLGAVITEFDPKKYVKPRKALKVMSREIQTGFSAAQMAVEQAQLVKDQIAPDRLGVQFGSQMLYCEPPEMEDTFRGCLVEGKFDFSRWGEVAMARTYPLWMLKYLPNMIACHIGIAHDARGPNNTICQGEASSLLALIEAAWIIQRDRADVMIVGGSSSRISTTPMLFRRTIDLSCRLDAAHAASRPFDATRDGMVNGEAAAAFVVENEQFARARGANILARISGWGLSFGTLDPDGSTHRRAIEQSIKMALESARLQPADVGHVNAHAAGIVSRDPVEAQAIRAVLDDVPVTAPKSYVGNSGAAGGAVEMVASVLALCHGEIPVTLNFAHPDPACPVNVVHGQAQPVTQRTAVALSQSSAGQTVAVVLAADE
jgi:3-oxoacyl-[acyl-carrier-protein] synthase II